VENEPGPDPGGRSGRPPGARSPATSRAAAKVTVPVWRLPPAERAELLRIVRAGGRAQCRGPARDQIIALLQSGYLAPYDEGTVILTPGALRAIAAEADRRASARPQGDGDPAEGEGQQR
jgi:hypothetical protein